MFRFLLLPTQLMTIIVINLMLDIDLVDDGDEDETWCTKYSSTKNLTMISNLDPQQDYRGVENQVILFRNSIHFHTHRFASVLAKYISRYSIRETISVTLRNITSTAESLWSQTLIKLSLSSLSSSFRYLITPSLIVVILRMFFIVALISILFKYRLMKLTSNNSSNSNNFRQRISSAFHIAIGLLLFIEYGQYIPLLFDHIIISGSMIIRRSCAISIADLLFIASILLNVYFITEKLLLIRRNHRRNMRHDSCRCDSHIELPRIAEEVFSYQFTGEKKLKNFNYQWQCGKIYANNRDLFDFRSSLTATTTTTPLITIDSSSINDEVD